MKYFHKNFNKKNYFYLHIHLIIMTHVPHVVYFIFIFINKKSRSIRFNEITKSTLKKRSNKNIDIKKENLSLLIISGNI